MSSYKVLTFAAHDLPVVYQNLVLSRWMRSLRYGSILKLALPHLYYQNMTQRIQELMDAENADVNLAVLSDDQEIVLGFSVYNENVLHYVHVHKDHRKIGIGTKLIPKGIDSFTYLTDMGHQVWKRHYPQWGFDPFL